MNWEPRLSNGGKNKKARCAVAFISLLPPCLLCHDGLHPFQPGAKATHGFLKLILLIFCHSNRTCSLSHYSTKPHASTWWAPDNITEKCGHVEIRNSVYGHNSNVCDMLHVHMYTTPFSNICRRYWMHQSPSCYCVNESRWRLSLAVFFFQSWVSLYAAFPVSPLSP